MSNFSQKLLKNELPSEADWGEHLLEAHRLAPGMAPDAFAGYRTAEGLNSYEVLLSAHSSWTSDLAILDLACGDGHFLSYLLPRMSPRSRVVGLDMSPDELALARGQFQDPRVSFVEGMAQALPFADAEFDSVFCHMAIMLMLPVEPVIAELARVLKSQGVFSAVVGDQASSTGLYAEIAQLGARFRFKRYPLMKDAKTGDPRIRSDEGLRELFSPALGFREQIRTRQFSIQVATSPDGVWRFLQNMYFTALLPEAEREELRKELVDFLSTRTDGGGNVAFEFPFKMFSVTKR